MNDTQVKVLAAFDTAMQTFTEVWEDESTTRECCLAAYGGASFALLLARQTTDISNAAEIAAKLLNDAATQLNLPTTN